MAKSEVDIDKTKIAMNSLDASIKNFSHALKKSFAPLKLSYGFLEKISQSSIAFAENTSIINANARSVGLSISEYQALSYAFEMQGVSSEQMSSSMKYFNKLLVDVKSGESNLYNQLQQTNPSLFDQMLHAKSTSDAFLLAVEAVNAQSDAKTQATLVNNLFGDSNAQLNNIIRAGSKTIQADINTKKQYGTLTNEQAKSVESFNQSQMALHRIMVSTQSITQSLSEQFMSGLFSSLSKVDSKFASIIEKNSDLISTFLASVSFVEKVNSSIKNLKANILAIKDIFKSFRKASNNFNVFLKSLSGRKILLITIGLIALIGATFLLAKNFSKIKEYFYDSFPVMANMLTGILTIILKLPPAILTVVSAVWLWNTANWVYTNRLKIAALYTAAVTKATQLWTLSQLALNVALNMNPLGLVIIGIVALSAIIILMIKNWDKVKESILAIGHAIRYAFSFEFLKKVGNSIFDVIMHPIESLKTSIEWIIKKIDWAFGEKKKLEEDGPENSIASVVNPNGSTPYEGVTNSFSSPPGEDYAQANSTQTITIDVNFINLPKGTMISSSKPSQGVNLNLGCAGS